MFCDHMFKRHRAPPTYTEEERDDAMLGLDLELVIWGYLMLEYSLSFILFLCKGTTRSQPGKLSHLLGLNPS